MLQHNRGKQKQKKNEKSNKKQKRNRGNMIMPSKRDKDHNHLDSMSKLSQATNKHKRSIQPTQGIQSWIAKLLHANKK